MTFLLLNIHSKLLQDHLNQQWSGLVEWVWNTHTHIYLYKIASRHLTDLKCLNTWMDLCCEINACRIRIYSPAHSFYLRKHFQEREALLGWVCLPPFRSLKSRDMFYNLQRAYWQISILSTLTDCLSVKLPLSCIPPTANSCTETFTFTATTCTLCNLCHWSLIQSSAHMFFKCLHK